MAILKLYPHLLHAFPVIVVGLMIFGLGAATLRKEGICKVSLAFLFLTISSAFWLVFIGLSYLFPKELIFYFYGMEHLGVIFIPSALLVFSFCIVNRWTEYRYWAYAALALSLSFYAVFTFTDLFIEGLYHYYWGYYPNYGPAAVALFFVFNRGDGDEFDFMSP